MRRQKLTLIEGLKIQRNQLSEFVPKLSSDLLRDLYNEARRRNRKLTKSSDGFDVWRGHHFDQFIGNWSPRPLPKLNDVFTSEMIKAHKIVSALGGALRPVSEFGTEGVEEVARG